MIKKLGETTNLFVKIMNSRRQAMGKLDHVVQIDVNVMLKLFQSITFSVHATSDVSPSNYKPT